MKPNERDWRVLIGGGAIFAFIVLVLIAAFSAGDNLLGWAMVWVLACLGFMKWWSVQQRGNEEQDELGKRYATHHTGDDSQTV